MFVSAPYLSTNGSAYWHDQGYGGHGNWSYDPGIALANLETAPVATYASYSGIRVRENMQKGIIGRGQYVNTPYHSFAANYKFEEGKTLYKSTNLYYGKHTYRATKMKPWTRSTGGAWSGGIGFPHERWVLDATNSAWPTHHQVYNQSIAECLLKLRANRFDLSESLVGLRQTVGMVGLRVARVLNAYKALRRGDVGGVRAALGLRRLNRTQERRVTPSEIASLWLEYQFGFKPLLNDIYAGISIVNEGLQHPDSVATVVRRISRSLKSQGPFCSSACTSTAHKLRGRSMAETKIVYKVDDSTMHYLTQLGIENPLYMAWVAMPFSFVVDWIAPVADWLQALSAPLGLEFVSSYTTRKVEVTETQRFYQTQYASNYRYQSGGGSSCALQMCQIKRTVHTSWPGFLPYLKSPFTSTIRATNALALFVGLSPRR